MRHMYTLMMAEEKEQHNSVSCRGERDPVFTLDALCVI